VRARRRLPPAPWRHVAADALIVSTRRALKVSEKGGLSVYGLGRFPVTLYKEQWTQLLDNGRRHPRLHPGQRGEPQDEELTGVSTAPRSDHDAGRSPCTAVRHSCRGGSDFGKEANDGTVAVASELSMPIQRQAVHVMGFNESHTSILEINEVAALLNATLLRASGAQQ